MKSGICMLFCCVLVLSSSGSMSHAQKDVESLFEKGKIHLKSKNYQEAIQAFSSVLSLVEPDKRNAHVATLARAEAYLGKGEHKSAWNDVNSILESSGVDGEIRARGLQFRGMLNLRQNRETKALADFTEAIKAAHGNHSLRALSFANRGIVFINMDDLDKAISDLNKAIELDPKSAFPYAGRGLAYLRSDNIQAARRDAQHALSASPDETARKLAHKILQELSISASGPLSVSVPMGEGGHIFVQVRFSKKGTPHRFLLDTGATFSLVDPELLAQIQQETEVKKIGKSSVKTADGSMHRVTRYKVKNVFLYNLPLGEIEVHVFDGKAQRVTNLLGIRSLRNVAVSIDNKARKAEISRTDSVDHQKVEKD